MASEPFKPCPFCGAMPFIRTGHSHDVWTSTIGCPKCPADMKANGETLEGAKAAALKLWNRRDSDEEDY